MRITRLTRTALSILFIFLVSINGLPQLRLGPQALTSFNAPGITEPGRLTIRRSGLPAKVPLRLLQKMGGVAFDGVASPASGTAGKKVVLGYSPTRKDGERLLVWVDGRPITAPIFDWQLIPIARFANTDDVVGVTSIYDGIDAYRYHPAFKDTLLGLRLFQLDILIRNDFATDLPKRGEDYVLGEGETPPSLASNERGLAAFKEYELSTDFDWDKYWYLISNRNRHTVFDFADNKLSLTESPSYFFWRQSDEALYGRLMTTTYADQEALVDEEMPNRLVPAARKRWLVNKILVEVGQFAKEIDTEIPLGDSNGNRIKAVMHVEGKKRPAFLQRLSLDELQETLVQFRVYRVVLNPIEEPELTMPLLNETEMIRAINPAVWDAGVSLMRFSAFFRYCKEKNPLNWKAFMRQIGNVQPEPDDIETPNHIDVKRRDGR